VICDMDVGFAGWPVWALDEQDVRGVPATGWLHEARWKRLKRRSAGTSSVKDAMMDIMYLPFARYITAVMDQDVLFTSTQPIGEARPA
jgi:hypothetical protein